MQQPTIKIYISCHKKCFIPEHPLLYPIQVGAALAPERFAGMLHDDEGENISEKNRNYCELTAQYWAWKNNSADYYGFFHYRRYMSFAKDKLPTNVFGDAELECIDEQTLERLGLAVEQVQQMRDVIEKYDIIATTPVQLKLLNRNAKTNYEQYCLPDYQYAEDLDVLLDIIKEKYPQYYDTAYEYLHNFETGYFCNMFIMKRKLFEEYSAWLFDILAEHERRRDYTDYTVTGYRVSGYLAERLFGIYYLYKTRQGARISADAPTKCNSADASNGTDRTLITLELQRTLFTHVDAPAIIKPAFAEHNIAIALAANDYFVPYTATTLASIMQNATSANNYDVLLLTSDISSENRDIMLQMVQERPNFSLRFVNPARLLEGYTFYTRAHFSLETYYRLVLPELLPEYDRILYLDSDMVVESDVAELYHTPLGDHLVAACRDADSAGLYNGYEPRKKKYVDEVLQLKKPYDYFQAGTLVMNLAAFRETYTTAQILKFSAKEKWELLDQDILNVLCEGRVQYVDIRWNVMTDYAGLRVKEIIPQAPQWLCNMYMEARKNPHIIHYAGADKPWKKPDMDMASRFWKYARLTPFYEVMLWRLSMGSRGISGHGSASGKAGSGTSGRGSTSSNAGSGTNGHGSVANMAGSIGRLAGIIGILSGGIRCIRDHGLKYTLTYLPKRLKK